ncbi:hypothetical protein ACH4U5_22310 [Streptomyces sp. NPDC020858]|uniref:hypothetical protein n=1 Tax=Streptomyces sp. NPDC020858 TaxID=3365097 RepID=UPI00378A986B
MTDPLSRPAGRDCGWLSGDGCVESCDESRAAPGRQALESRMKESMEERFERFVKTHLNLIEGYDVSGYLRPTLPGFNESFVEVVRSGFAQALAGDSFGPAEYERLTDIEFPDQETLDAYLQAMYDYLFNYGSEQPLPPE